ncbi:hypothetical protein HK096_007573, partial [Nowakowskiella sp. JEL0078]
MRLTLEGKKSTGKISSKIPFCAVSPPRPKKLNFGNFDNAVNVSNIQDSNFQGKGENKNRESIGGFILAAIRASKPVESFSNSSYSDASGSIASIPPSIHGRFSFIQQRISIPGGKQRISLIQKLKTKQSSLPIIQNLNKQHSALGALLLTAAKAAKEMEDMNNSIRSNDSYSDESSQSSIDQRHSKVNSSTSKLRSTKLISRVYKKNLALSKDPQEFPDESLILDVSFEKTGNDSVGEESDCSSKYKSSTNSAFSLETSTHDYHSRRNSNVSRLKLIKSNSYSSKNSLKSSSDVSNNSNEDMRQSRK